MEEAIIKLLSEYYVQGGASSESLLGHWVHLPQSELWTMSHPYGLPGAPMDWARQDTKFTTLWVNVDLLIKEADLAMCLTSKYKYIRECKKYYESKK